MLRAASPGAPSGESGTKAAVPCCKCAIVIRHLLVPDLPAYLGAACTAGPGTNKHMPAAALARAADRHTRDVNRSMYMQVCL